MVVEKKGGYVPSKLRGSFALLGASLTIAFFGTLVHLLKPMFGTITQTAVRALLAAIFMAGIVLIIQRRWLSRLTKKEWLLVAIIGICTSTTLGLFGFAALHDKAASATLMIFAGSILTSIIGGMIFLKERATFIRVAAILLVVMGLFLYADGFAYKGIATIAGLVGGMSDGVANLLRKQLRRTDRATVVTYQYAIGAIAAFLFVWTTGEQQILQIGLVPIMAMIAFAVLALCLGTLLLYGYAHVDMQTGAVLSAMQVFFAIILGALFLHQMPTVNELVGCLLIGSASCLAVLNTQKVLAGLQRFRRPQQAELETE